MVFTAGRYRLLERLGSGGMGEVFRAHDYLTDEIVALKQIRYAPPLLSFSQKPDQENPAIALAREFRTLATLRHPNVISVLDFGFVNSGRPYYTMSLLENARDLAAIAQKCDTAGKVALLIEVLQALIYLHRRGILHRDLKPGNVLVDAAGQVRVLDFGLSIEQELAQGFVGTLAYMAPEVLEKEHASVASDLYSVGVMAYEFLAGRHPYDTKRMHTLVREIISTVPDFAVIQATPALRSVIECLLSKNPADRYPNAETALAALCHAADVPLPTESVRVRESFLRSAKFIGRNQEYGLLTTALVQAKQGNGSGWLVTGEFGVGKSRLVDEIRIQALVQGFSVLRAQMNELQPDLLQSLCDALLPLLLVTTLTASEAELLKPLIPALDRLMGYSIAPLVPSVRQAAAFQVIVALLARQSEPVLLIIEDLHWAGDDIALLRQLYDVARHHALLIIGTYGNDQAPYLYGKFDWQTNLIELRRFNRAEIENLAVSMLGQVARHPRVLDFIEHQSEGNVFFMIDVIHSLMEDADRLEDIGHVQLPIKLLSQGLLGSARRRLARVPFDYHPMLRLAAVLGRELDLKLLHYVDDELYYPHWLAVCSDAAVLEVVEGKWRFAHDKIRDALLLDVDLRRLLELHQLAAEAIETVYPDKPEYAPALANHWYVAGVLEKEEYYTRLAGIHLLDKGNLVRAETYLRRAKMLSVQHDPLVFESLVMVLKHRGKLEEAFSIAEELLALSAQHPEWRLRAIITYFSVVAEVGMATEGVDVQALLQEGLQHAHTTLMRDEATRMYKAAAQWVIICQADADGLSH
jgi:tRNA A-37 threonylcarbamoyl transferase component Bud32